MDHNVFKRYVDSQYTEIEEQLICANCGKKSSGYYEELDLPEGETYKGNSKVMSKHKSYRFKNSVTYRLSRGTYRAFKYGHFCRLRCAEAFANAAVEAGYRR